MRPTWLDAMVQRFQHNWETNPQFRAMVSGVLGLVIVVGLCATMGAAAIFASNVGGAFAGGGGGTNAFVTNGGSNPQATDVTFPMTTLTPWPNPQYPAAAPLPASGTPMPSPTPLPTATPQPTCDPSTDPNHCAGPGGGGGGGGGGNSDHISVSVSPSPFTVGTQVYASIHTSTPNEMFAISITWPNGGFVPQGVQGMTDGSGNATKSLGTVQGSCPGTMTLWVVTQNNQTGVRQGFSC